MKAKNAIGRKSAVFGREIFSGIRWWSEFDGHTFFRDRRMALLKRISAIDRACVVGSGFGSKFACMAICLSVAFRHSSKFRADILVFQYRLAGIVV